MTKMKEHLDILMKAREIDQQLYDAELALGEIPQARAEKKSEFEREKAHLRELEDALKKLQLKQKEKEGELAQKEGNVKKLDGQLSQVKTNKEYATLQQEIASLKADNSLLEEDIIKILDEIEAASEEVKKEKVRLQECEKKYQAEEKQIDAQEKQSKDIVEKFKGQRQSIINQLPPDVQELYEKILAKKQGRALAPVQGQACGACQIHIRPQVLNEIMLGDALVLCENCSRILYKAE